MAAVTQVTRPIINVNGAVREIYQRITIATSGDTLTVPFRTFYECDTNDVAITKITPTASSAGTSLAFTTTGAVTAAYIKVTGQ